MTPHLFSFLVVLQLPVTNPSLHILNARRSKRFACHECLLDPYEDYEILIRVEINNNRISNRNVWEKPVKSLYHMRGPFRAHRSKGENPCFKLLFRQKRSFCAKVLNERVPEFFLPRAQRAEERR